ncbi:MAG: Ig-like domain-containing protein, partial [Methyloligellaceae bacterium]
MSITSDDFSGETIDPIWQLEGTGASQNLATSGDEAYLELVVPSGTYNAWHTNTAVRSMQAADNEDFEVEARFLSAPTDDYQNHGILIEQDDANFIRFDVYHDGTSLHLFGAATTNGTSVSKFNITISEGDADYLRVTRSGSNWVFQYSADGVNWSTAGSYNHSLNVSATGVFAAAQNDGYVAQVDYFVNTAEPIANEDGSISQSPPPDSTNSEVSATQEAPVGVDDSYSTGQDTALQVTTPGVLDNDTDANGDTLTAVLISDVSNGTLALNSDGSFNYTPEAGFYGADSFVYRADDGTGQSSDVTVTISVDAPAGDFISDDFSGASLDPRWSLEGPGGSVDVATSGAESYMELVVPTGTFNAWKTNTAVRAIQDITDGDFGVEARFLSNPTGDYQNHGILIEQDATNFIRFDVYHDGSALHLFGATTANGTSAVKFNLTISEGDAEYLRVNRVGNSWTFEYSSDGVNWNTAGAYSHAMTVTGAGPFGAAQNGGYVAEIDYFFNTASPILSEDGAYVPQEEAPVGTDDSYQTEQDVALQVPADGVLANDTDANGDALTAVLISDVSNGTLVLNSDGSFSYTPDSGFTGTDSFVYRADDGTGQSGDVTVTLSVDLPPSELVSDDFSGVSLDPMWALEGSGGSAVHGVDGDEKYLEIVVPTGAFNAWRTNTAIRTIQDVTDGDFSLEARFLSNPTGDYQNQGILVEQDDTNFVRFDVYHNGSSLYLFGATNSNSNPVVLFNTAISAGAAEYLRVNRTGDNWTFEYSSDGVNWNTAGSTNFAMNVTAAGPFAAAQNDGFVAQVDYFFNTASPVLPEDGVVTGGNSAPVGVNDSYTTDV